MSRKRKSSSIPGGAALDALFAQHRANSVKARKVPAMQQAATAMDLATMLGIKGGDSAKALDFFSNPAARTGYGTPNLTEAATYPLVRLTFDYFQLISLFEGSWIARRIVETPAKDMVRAWPKLTSDISPKELTKIDRVLRKTNSKNVVLTAMTWARLFGGAGALMVIDGQEHELDQPLDLDSIPINGFKGLCAFDRWSGIYPGTEICTDIKRPIDFNLPESYNVQATGGQSFKVHASRILRFTGPTVPTPEREAYSMWGVSVIEPVYQELQKRDNVSWNIVNLTFRACILGMKMPDLASLMSGLGMPGNAGMQFEQRMSQLNHMLSNQSLIPLAADGGIESTQYTFAGLGEVMQQTCLDVSGAAEIPVTRLWGRTISGLGGSENEGDERIYEERIATDQDAHMRPQLEKLYPVLCASELGEVPDDLDLNFPSIRVMDEKSKSELAKTTADTLVVYLNAGVMSPRTMGKEIKQSSDATGVGTNLTDEDIAKLSDDVSSEGELGEGMFGEGSGGLNPASGPAKALKEENHAGEGKPQPDGPDAPKGSQAPPVGPKKEPAKAKAADQDGAGILGGPRRKIHGLDVVIETPKGYERHGKGWSTTMPYDYGYFPGIPGADGDSLDAAVGPESDGQVYVIDQSVLGDPSHFDEHKAFLNWPSAKAALDAFRQGHHKAKDVFMGCTAMDVNDFKEWLKNGDHSRPMGDQQ